MKGEFMIMNRSNTANTPKKPFAHPTVCIVPVTADDAIRTSGFIGDWDQNLPTA